MSKCLTDNNKKYIIPTQKWLQSIEKLITPDSNTAGLVMIADLIDKEKVIVKITKNKNKKILILSMKLNPIYNFVHTYSSFICTEDYNKIKNEYKNDKTFCTTNSTDYVTIEVMKKYYGSLSILKYKLSRDQVANILSQIVLSLMEAFYKFGFVHEDLSLANILYRIKSTNEIIDYQLTNNDKMRINLNIGHIIPAISDYDKTQSYKKEIYEKYSIEPMKNLLKGYQNTIILFDSLSKIIQAILLLINNQNERNEIKLQVDNIISSPEYENYYRWTFTPLKILNETKIYYINIYIINV